MRLRHKTAALLGSVTLAVGAMTALPVAAYASTPTTCTVNGVSVTATTITGTAGNDTIVCLDGVLAGTTINAGGGNDTITITNTDEVNQLTSVNLGTINGGAGNDHITIDAGHIASLAIAANGGTINGGTGADTITLTGSANQGICGDGNASTGIVNGGAGIDTITVDGGGLGDSSGGIGNLGIINGGDGIDTIRVTGGGAGTTGSNTPAVANAGTINGGNLLDLIFLTGGDQVADSNTGTVNGDGDGTQGGTVDGGTCTFNPAHKGTVINCIIVDL